MLLKISVVFESMFFLINCSHMILFTYFNGDQFICSKTFSGLISIKKYAIFYLIFNWFKKSFAFILEFCFDILTIWLYFFEIYEILQRYPCVSKFKLILFKNILLTNLVSALLFLNQFSISNFQMLFSHSWNFDLKKIYRLIQRVKEELINNFYWIYD